MEVSMKNLSKILALLLCFLLIVSSPNALAGVKIKIGGGSSNSTEQTETQGEDVEESNNEADDTSDVESNNTVSEPSSAPASDEEFKLQADFKTIKGENVRFFVDGAYSFTFLESGTYLKYVRHTDDTVEVETFINGKYSRAWLPTSSVVLAATIIKKDGKNELVSELDPDFKTKVAAGKVVATAGKDNPLINTSKLKDIDTLLTNSLKYDHTGLKLEPNATAGGKTTSSSTGGNNSGSTSNTLKTNKTITIGVKTAGTGSSKDGKVSNPINATIQREELGTLYSERNRGSEVLANLKVDDTLEVHNLGAAFSYVVAGETAGYLQTYALKFETGNDFLIISDKSGKTALREDASASAKKLKDLPNGTIALVLEESDKFIKVNVNGVEGYIAKTSSKFINLAETIHENALVNKEKVKARTGAAKTNPVVEALKKDLSVVVIEQNDDWTQIELPNGKTAFIESAFLDMQ